MQQLRLLNINIHLYITPLSFDLSYKNDYRKKKCSIEMIGLLALNEFSINYKNLEFRATPTVLWWAGPGASEAQSVQAS